MPTVAELTAPYSNFMRAPRPGPGVCGACFNLTAGYRHCYACSRIPSRLDAIGPISYSIAHEQLHLALAAYKRAPATVARRFQIELAAVLWRHLQEHESCLAAAAGAGERFDLVTTVPSSRPDRDEHHPLARLVGELVAPVRDRVARLLVPTGLASATHTFHAEKFAGTTRIEGASVLLIDDTWTTGANGQSAAVALKAAGASAVAIVPIGRHVNRDWHDNDRRLRALPATFEWERCSRCRAVRSTTRPARAASCPTPRPPARAP